jgi:hypothetical protein
MPDASTSKFAPLMSLKNHIQKRQSDFISEKSDQKNDFLPDEEQISYDLIIYLRVYNSRV